MCGMTNKCSIIFVCGFTQLQQTKRAMATTTIKIPHTHTHNNNRFQIKFHSFGLCANANALFGAVNSFHRNQFNSIYPFGLHFISSSPAKRNCAKWWWENTHPFSTKITLTAMPYSRTSSSDFIAPKTYKVSILIYFGSLMNEYIAVYFNEKSNMSRISVCSGILDGVIKFAIFP